MSFFVILTQYFAYYYSSIRTTRMATRILMLAIFLAHSSMRAASESALTVIDLVRTDRISWCDAVKTEMPSGQKYLDLAEFGLTRLDGLADLPGIATVQRLDVRDNKLSSLSRADLECMPELQSLYVDRNKLVHIAEDTFEATPKLTALSLSNNQLCDAASVLRVFRRLQYIDMACNNLGSFKPSIANTVLQCCNVAHNPAPYASADVGALVVLCSQLKQFQAGVFCTQEHYTKTVRR